MVDRYPIEHMRALANSNPSGSWLDPHLADIEREAAETASAESDVLNPEAVNRLYRKIVRMALMDLFSEPGREYRLERLRLSAPNNQEPRND